ncbi:glycosyltransferase family 25 protein [Celeribacter sp.]|uniref:glycosyltransferase family 25 protein n=1 Tax=Celeribacter sp. TaxID=1890673 RepID=UPI003A95B28E
MAPHPFAALDAIYVINLDSRPDRLRAIEGELARIGLSFASPNVIRHAAYRPQSQGSFPSLGARGCFISHLTALKAAHGAGHKQVLILEDDALFTMRLRGGRGAELAAHLETRDWDMSYLGFRLMDGSTPHGRGWRSVAPDTDITCAHAIVWRGPAIARAIPYLDAMLAREAGDPAGGPMHVDGAYNWLRRASPDLIACRAARQIVTQRASDSDIAARTRYRNSAMIGLLRRLKDFRARWA